MYNTDLANESLDRLKEKGVEPGKPDGVLIEHENFDGGIKITKVEITNQRGSIIMGKPIGKYVTMEIDGVLDDDENIIKHAAVAVSEQLKNFVTHNYRLKVLICGLGNELVTPDKLGPLCASKIKVTRHLFQMFNADGDEEMSQTSVLFPRVLAMTGIETLDLIKKAVDITKPDAVIAIDALAAGQIERVGRTVQLSDTGIMPGAGIGNKRKELNEKSVGCPVIAIGVPTVIGTKNLIWDALDDFHIRDEEKHQILDKKDFDMIVTHSEIDVIVDKFSQIIADAVNITLHPGIYL